VSFEFNNLSVHYGTHPVLQGLSDRWEDGQITTLIGCNGAGKSSLLRALAGLMPCNGALRLSGRSLSPADQRTQIAYMPQDTGAGSSLTVLEVVLLGRQERLGLRVSPQELTAAERALEVFGLNALQNRRLDQLSGGQRQLVYLSQVLFRAPKVLLLDEPTAALDLRHQLVVLERLHDHARQTGTIICMAMHDLTLAARYADRMIGLKDGTKIAAGSVRSVLTCDNLRQMYGIDAEIAQDGQGRIQVTPLRASTG